MSFCPKCKSEYRPGFIVCTDCNVQLVDVLGKEQDVIQQEAYFAIDEKSLKFISIFVSDEAEEAQEVKRILTDNNIPFVTRGEDATRFRYTDFLVREDKAVEARNLLKDIMEKESEGIALESTIPEDEENQDTDETMPAQQEVENPAAKSGVEQPGKTPIDLWGFILVAFILFSIWLLFIVNHKRG